MPTGGTTMDDKGFISLMNIKRENVFGNKILLMELYYSCFR